ncbi:MAG TPA: response regulator transcription factor [Chloroflexota bacterium]|nr:response regulator transcription factor [Chloroflexota bacterium]
MTNLLNNHAIIAKPGVREDVDRIRIIIADEHPLFRAGMRAALEREESFQVVAEAGDGDELLAYAESLTPEVVLVDVNMPGVAGLQVTREIKKRLPSTAVVLLTAVEEEEQLFNAIRFGAAAYMLKDVTGEELIDVIRRASSGTYLINDSVLAKPVLASRVLSSFRELATEDQHVKPLFVPLSAREVEVLEYAAKGNSNKEIARALSISDQTVKNHLTSIMRKLAVNDRTQAVVYALQQGWIKMHNI